MFGEHILHNAHVLRPRYVPVTKPFTLALYVHGAVGTLLNVVAFFFKPAFNVKIAFRSFGDRAVRVLRL